MSGILTDDLLFVDTNILLYAITGHPRFGSWCDFLLNRIQRGELNGYISVIVLNELVHKLTIGEIAQKVGLEPGQVVRYLKQHRMGRQVTKRLGAWITFANLKQELNYVRAVDF